MKKLIVSLWDRAAVRYIFFGGCTTLVNLVSFWALRRFTPLSIHFSNILSIFLAIVFAFLVNGAFVFRSQTKGLAGKMAEFAKFFGGRLSTMLVEVGGVWLLADVLRAKEFFAKFVTQFIVLALNFLISKYFVFRKKNITGE